MPHSSAKDLRRNFKISLQFVEVVDRIPDCIIEQFDLFCH
jgi:hypothetical protein